MLWTPKLGWGTLGQEHGAISRPIRHKRHYDDWKPWGPVFRSLIGFRAPKMFNDN